MIGGPEEMMPQRVILDLFHISRETLKRWRKERNFPAPRYIGETPFYRAIEVRLWQEEQLKNTEPPPKAENLPGKRAGKV